MNTLFKKVSYSKLIGAFLFSLYFFNALIMAREEWHFIDWVNLIIHEAGHTFLFFCGEFIHVLGGSFFQVFIPLVFVCYFILERDFFSGSLVSMWVAQNIASVAHYAGDAQAQILPLLGGDSVIHDWNYLLTATNLLPYTETIARILYGTSLFVFMCAVVSAYYCAFINEKTSDI